MTIRTNFLKCFAVRAVGNAPQPQISVINVVSNLIRVRSRIRGQVRLTRKKLSKCWVKQHMNSYHCSISHSSSNLRLFHMTIFQMHYEYIIYPVTSINTSQRLFLVIPRSLAVSVENETWGEIDWNALICIASQCLSPPYVISIFLTKLRWLKDKKRTFYWLEANYL